MSLTKIIKIKSSHDSSHTNHAVWRTQLGMTEQALQRCRAISLIGAIIPNKSYNINSLNNVLRYDLDSGGDASLTVPVGNYTTAELMAVVATTLTGVTITQQDYTSLINFASGSGTTIDISSLETDALSTLAPFLGITTDISLGNSANIDADVIPDLNGLDAVLVESARLAPSNLISSGTDGVSEDYNVIACIPITVSFGYNEIWVQETTEQSKVLYDQPRNITDIDIRLTDLNHNVLDLQSESTLIFRAYYDRSSY